MLSRIARTLIYTATIAIAACSQTAPHKPDPRDPYENYNRVVFSFNQKIDNAILKPVAYAYLAYLPSPFQFGFSNFFDNLREIPNVANDILQAQFGLAMHDLSRFLINSTVGIFGVFDPATSLGLEHRKEDFGQTLYVYGYHDSAYLVIPFLGPSTIRDGIGMGVDYFALTIWPWIESDWKYAFLAVDYIDLRARLLRRQPVFDVVAVDEYNFVRDAYFQHRQYLFGHGKNDDEIKISVEADDDVFFEKEDELEQALKDEPTETSKSESTKKEESAKKEEPAKKEDSAKEEPSKKEDSAKEEPAKKEDSAKKETEPQKL